MARDGSSESGRSPGSGSLQALGHTLRAHPWLAALMIGCSVLGALIGAFALDADWSLARRALAGAVAGAGSALLVSAARMLD